MTISPKSVGLPHEKWRPSQFSAFTKVQEKHNNGGGIIFTELPTGCVSGDTTIRISRANKERIYTIKDALKETNTTWNKDIKSNIRCFIDDENIIGTNEVYTFVYSGIKETYCIKLENGMSLRATPDHEIMTFKGYLSLAYINVGDLVLCDTNTRKPIFSKVIEISFFGSEKTYDIVCKDPYRNFVANGIVIHNCGKSGIATALGQNNDILVLVQTLGLLDQYEKVYGFDVIRGRQEYTCVHRDKKESWLSRYGKAPTAADCHLSRMEDCSDASKCPYLKARYRALESRRCACTYKYAFLSSEIKKRGGIMVFDEAHESGKEILSVMELKFTRDQTKRMKLPELPFSELRGKDGKLMDENDKSKFLSWLDNCLKVVSSIDIFDIMTREGSDKKNMEKQIMSALGIMERESDLYVKIVSEASGWPYKPNKDNEYLQVRPLSARTVTDDLFRNKQTTLLMSATIGDPKPLATELGIEDYDYYSYPHPVPYDKRPVYDLQLERMTKKNTDNNPSLFGIQGLMIWRAIEKLPQEWRGIVLTSSYQKISFLRKYLKDKMPERVMIPDMTAKSVTDRIIQFISDNRKGTIVVDTIQGWGSGLDLRGDIARFAVVAGVPFVNPSDTYEKLRMQLPGGKTYALWGAYNSVVQSSGRVSRGEIVDGEFETNVAILADGSCTTSEAKRFMPSWFTESIVLGCP